MRKNQLPVEVANFLHRLVDETAQYDTVRKPLQCCTEVESKHRAYDAEALVLQARQMAQRLLARHG